MKNVKFVLQVISCLCCLLLLSVSGAQAQGSATQNADELSYQDTDNPFAVASYGLLGFGLQNGFNSLNYQSSSSILTVGDDLSWTSIGKTGVGINQCCVFPPSSAALSLNSLFLENGDGSSMTLSRDNLLYNTNIGGVDAHYGLNSMAINSDFVSANLSPTLFNMFAPGPNFEFQQLNLTAGSLQMTTGSTDTCRITPASIAVSNAFGSFSLLPGFWNVAGVVQITPPQIVGGPLLDVGGDVYLHGDVGVGVSVPSCKVDVAGDVCSNGVVLTSDKRFKKNIQPIENSLQKIKNINGVSYYMKTEMFKDRNFSANQKLGLIAQNVEQEFPELVMELKDGYKAVDYIGLIPVLVEALKQEHQERLSQDQKIESLENELFSMKLSMEKMEQLVAEMAKAEVLD